MNPADPTLLMRDTVFCSLGKLGKDADRVAVFVNVEGAGDYVPACSGNLDIMRAADAKVDEGLAHQVIGQEA